MHINNLKKIFYLPNILFTIKTNLLLLTFSIDKNKQFSKESIEIFLNRFRLLQLPFLLLFSVCLTFALKQTAYYVLITCKIFCCVSYAVLNELSKGVKIKFLKKLSYPYY